MKSDFYILIIFSTILITFSSCNNQKTNNVDFALTYPETKVTDVKDNYFGTEVADPYRWLEDDNSEETAEWVKAQNEVSFKYLESIPYREKIRDRLVKIWDYPKVSAPTEKDGLYFYFRNDGLQNQSVLYYKKGLESEEIELLDPNNFDKEGTVSLSNACISEDCKYLVYAISRAGSDWREIYVRDIETLKDLDDHL
ncbi:MAG: S9 family peptidase, partial [Bacteroidales bacterium]